MPTEVRGVENGVEMVMNNAYFAARLGNLRAPKLKMRDGGTLVI